MNIYRDCETNGLGGTGTGEHRDWETWGLGNMGNMGTGEHRDWVI